GVLALLVFCVFYFTDPAPTEVSTLSLHDALPISADAVAQLFGLCARACDEKGEARLIPQQARCCDQRVELVGPAQVARVADHESDRKSTRLNSSHLGISYAVFCLKKKKTKTNKPK